MWLFPIAVLLVSVLLAFPVGSWMTRVFDSRQPPRGFLGAIEALIDTGPQSAKVYLLALVAFNVVLFTAAYVGLVLQPWHPLNPERRGALAPTTVLHTDISFITNNSLQHYVGDQHLSYCSQITVIVGCMFAGGAVSLCSLLAAIRGLRGDGDCGNFYVDLWRGLAYVFVPIALVVGLMHVVAGSPMTLAASAHVDTTEAASQVITRGPVAALLPIKNLASVGGGYFAANSSHPFENPTAGTNFVQCVSILLFPCAVIVLFGQMLGQMRHALILFATMLALFTALIVATVAADSLTPNVGLTGLPIAEDLGNLEGKELRYGRTGSTTFAAVTTAVACGSVNCMHDSMNPLAGLPLLTGMWLNCVFGGKGVGLLNLLVFVIVTVFLTGLMVGRTPEYLGKKVEAREMKLAMLAFLIHPFLILAPTALFASTPWGPASITNPGPHGFSQILYEFTSASAGNGSEFAGLQQTWGLNDNPEPAPYSPQWDVSTALVMLLSRFIPIIAAITLTSSLAAKTPTPCTVGTLRTDTLTFGGVLLGVILLLGALVFLPAAVLGPVAEHYLPGAQFGR